MPPPALVAIAMAQALATGSPAAGSPAPLLPGVIDSPDTEVRSAFSPDGRCVLWGSIGAPKTAWRILQTCREGADWSKPAAVSFDGPDNDFDPAFSPDGRTVYFFSNRPGGRGGDDLYAVDRDPATGTFGAPRNLGPRFNTPGDEWAPFPTADGKLIFSSDGHGGLGHQDLFEGGLAGEAPARNLGPGVNGPLDDFDATLPADGATLVFASGDLKAETRVALHAARRGEDGRFGPRTVLAAPVNCSEAINNGPAVDPKRPDVLYYSAFCPTLGPGRMDIFAVPVPTR
ncbi:PD40 domain-containing protein [Caulobacter sp. BK020]|uniref:PD40 domain-containing protein n=1 Tax=Caulobacter sp. BK020 TaxID=2512117 RepID=UPI0010F150B1|nr:PD40 domain-containing protein [Caulobacter sp. BK020]TCS14471.1 WD40 repeat protein [Caulobacter sp. BK020]